MSDARSFRDVADVEKIEMRKSRKKGGKLGRMEDVDGKGVSLVDVVGLLEKNCAYLSGGSLAGSPIVTFPNVSQSESLTQEQYVAVLQYLLSVIQAQTNEHGNGLVFIIDRYNSGWYSFKNVLDAVFTTCSELVERMFVLRPTGLMANLVEPLRMKSFKHEHRSKMVILNTIDDLHQHFEAGELTAEFGGTLAFNHHEWISNQNAMESVSTNAVRIRKELTKFCLEFDAETKMVPLPELETRYKCQAAERELIAGRLKSLLDQANLLAMHFKEARPSNGGPIPLPPSTVLHVAAMQRLCSQIKESQSKFDAAWIDHVANIEAVLKAKSAHEKYVKLKDKVDSHSNYLDSLSLSDEVLSSVENVQKRLAELRQLKDSLTADLNEARELKAECDGINFHTYGDIIIDIDGIELEVSKYHELVSSQVDQLQVTQKCLETVAQFKDKVDGHSKNLDSLSLSDEVLSSVENVQKRLAELHQLKDLLTVASSEAKELKAGHDGINLYTCDVIRDIDGIEVIVNKCHELVSSQVDQLQVTQKYHETVAKGKEWVERGRGLLDNAGESAKFLAKLSHFHASDSSLDELKKFQSGSNQIGSQVLQEALEELIMNIGQTLSAVEARRAIVHDKLVAVKRPLLAESESLPCGIASGMDKSPPSSRSATLSNRSMSHDIREVRKIVAFDKQELLSLDASGTNLTVVTNCESVRLRRTNVIQELIATEKTYTQDLEEILKGYVANIDSHEMQSLVPPELHENRGLLFDNIELIHQFHSGIFLKALESSCDSISDIAQCFVRHKEHLYLYTGYCQNKASSDAVIGRIGGDHNAFFVECMRKLKHSLPLTAYLLKPLQRLTKYQLLLRELAGVCTTKEEAVAMRDAVDAMRLVTQHVNDSMHQLLITGFDGDLSTLGKLLMQGELEVWTDRKSTRATRHVFLYEKCLLLCKKKRDDRKEESSLSHDQARYIFKNVIQTNQVGLRDIVKSSDARRFELSVSNHAGRSGEVWTMQALSKELKSEWVTHLQKLLIQQLCSIKRKKEKVVPNGQGAANSRQDGAAQPQTVRSDGNNNSNNSHGIRT